ncbi:hypothetical protein NQ314_020975 [Rhamnusium bicolor]|uniref:Uncharacterized protein n=1 Tax=Rhamnusium bicolor TaxID=1586634 RepID=A0AAV8WJL3_9CUCU|nr:hypothetical protein NQ314_020975 [Rhamnusium bicolor]
MPVRELSGCVTESIIQSYESGKSKFFVVLETPLPLPLVQNVNSPVPPPRTRHNPFNKPDNNPHQRSHSMRSTGSNSSRLDDSRLLENNSGTKISITFRELHNSYGRPILKDFNFWKHEQREKLDSNVDNLITF